MYTYQIIACLLLILFTIVASIDGLYFHLYKYRLFERKESIKEHHLHTANAFLFPITILLLFVYDVAGFLLWLSVVITILTLIIEFYDVFEEKKSRADLGGLTSLEYSMHFGMSGIRAAYTAIVLTQKPLIAWSLGSPFLIHETHYPLFVRVIGACVAGLALPIFILHYYLGRHFEPLMCSQEVTKG